MARVLSDRTRTWRAWYHMQDRCNNPAYLHYANYGGRGITYALRWELYDNFLSDMGICPTGMFFDRIDNNKNYTPDNCRWIARSISAENRRTTILTRDQVWTIKMLARARNPDVCILAFSTILADILGSTASLVRDVVRGKSWKHVGIV